MNLSVNYLLNSDLPFVLHKLNLPEDFKEISDALFTVKNISSIEFNYFGLFSMDKLVSKITDFVSQITPLDNSTKISEIVADITESYANSTNKNYIWLTLRIRFPTDEFDIPRWHFDGQYYQQVGSIDQTKLAGTIKGPGTLLKTGGKDVTTAYFETYRNLYTKDFDRSNKLADMTNRKSIDETLAKYKTVQASNSEAVIFVVGSPDRSAVHSEPAINSNRLFYSVVSGTRDQIEELANKWNEKFNEI